MTAATTAGRLLILDDEPMIAETVARMANNLNFHTAVTLKASEFFTQLRDFAPTHAIIDLSMPGVDGLEVLRRLDGHDGAKIIIHSGSGLRVMEAARRVGLSHGVNVIGILQKPFRLAQLKDLLMSGHSAITKPDEAKPASANRPHFTSEDLSGALARDEFSIYLQPKVRCSDGLVIGFESLARWHHPDHGLIMPDAFIGLFEQHGLETIWLEKLINLAASCLARLPAHIHLSVNLSMSERSKRSLPQLLDAAMQQAAFPSDRIVIEVIENGLSDVTSADIEMFARLRLGGFRLSIDDFGAGFSSLNRLVRIPFTELKIDRALVQEARASDETRNVIRSVVGIGHSLEMSVTAEGVEDIETLDIITSLGCDNIQGFVYSRPVPIAQAIRLVEAGGHLAPAGS